MRTTRERTTLDFDTFESMSWHVIWRPDLVDLREDIQVLRSRQNRLSRHMPESIELLDLTLFSLHLALCRLHSNQGHLVAASIPSQTRRKLFPACLPIPCVVLPNCHDTVTDEMRSFRLGQFLLNVVFS